LRYVAMARHPSRHSDRRAARRAGRPPSAVGTTASSVASSVAPAPRTRSPRSYGTSLRPGAAERRLRCAPASIPGRGLVVPHLLLAWRPHRDVHSICGVSREVEDLNRRLLRARDAMDRAYAEPLDVRAIAAVAHISPAHFSRCFRVVF